MKRIVFFDFISSNAGKPRCTVELMEALRGAVDFVFLDAYGTCQEFADFIATRSIDFEVVMPGARSDQIGHRDNKVRRGIAMLLAIPELKRLEKQIARRLVDHRCDGVWTSSLKGAAIARRAIERGRLEMPLWLHFRRTWHPRMETGWRNQVLSDPSVFLIAESKTNAQSLIDHGIAPERVRVIPNSVDIPRIQAQAGEGLQDELSRVEGMPNCLLNGTLHRRKGHLAAVRAIANIAAEGGGIGLLIPGSTSVGEGQAYFDEIRSLITRLGVEDRVRFIGWRKDMPAVINASDFTILPSSDEGFPLALVEAMALRRPVISTPVGGIRDLLIPGQTGWLHDVDDDKALAECMKQALNASVSGPIVDGAFQYIADYHSHERQRETGTDVFNMTL